ncbi:MAG TPA: hypothetical protein VFP90_10185, partial [Gemmatimonadaceae bacterium]|nr:hypothetical protein [Gemmatimonadaceae bacterium]
MRFTLAAFATLLASLPFTPPLAAQRIPTNTPQLAPAEPQEATQLRSAPITGVRYEVTADRAGLGEHRLHVVTTFGVSGTAPVALSLPDWTPGAYEIVNFARTVSGFGAVQGSDSLDWDKADYDTWRVTPRR